MKIRQKTLIITLISCFSIMTSSIAVLTYAHTQNEDRTGPWADELWFLLNITEPYPALENDEIDLAQQILSAEELEYATSNSDIAVNSSDDLGYYLFDLNHQRWPTSDIHFRRALAHLVDKDGIVTNILQGFGYKLDTPMPSILSGWIYPDVTVYEYDAALATVELELGGFIDTDSDGIRNDPQSGENMEPLIIYIRQDDSYRTEAGDWLVDELEALGVPVYAPVVDRSFITEKVFNEQAGNWSIYTAGWGIGEDPTHLADLYHSKEFDPDCVDGWRGYNYPGFVNDTYDYWADIQKNAGTYEEVLEATHKLQDIFASQVTGIPLYGLSGYNAYRTEWTGTVNEVGAGVTGWWSLYNMHQENQEEGGIIRYGFVSDVETLNPLTASWAWTREVLDKIFEYPFVSNPYDPNEYWPWLAESWEIENWTSLYGVDSLNVTFHFVENATWHDGVHFTAEDVKFTYEYLKQQNVAEYEATVALIAGLTLVDDYTLEVYLNTTSYFALSYLNGIPILPKHIWESVGDGWSSYDPVAEDTLIGLGPWKFADYVASEYVHLVANEDYFKYPLERARAVTEIGVIFPDNSTMEVMEPLVTKAETDINQYMEENGYNLTFDFLMENANQSAETHLEKVQGFKAIDINLLVAGAWSSQAQGSLDYINENNMLILSPSSTSPHITIADDNLFRLSPSDAGLAPVIAETLVSADIEALVIMQRNDGWGDAIANYTETEFTQRGRYVDSIIKYPAEAESFGGYLAMADDAIGDLITEYGVDHVGFLIVAFNEIETIVYQAEDYPNLWGVRWFGTESSAKNTQLINGVPSQAGHLKILSPYLTPFNNTNYQILDEWYTSEVGEPLGFYAANYYDACWVLALSTIEANSSNALDVKPILPTVAADYEGATGYITLDEAGDRDELNYDIWGYDYANETSSNVQYGYYNRTSGEVHWLIDIGTLPEAVVQWNVTMTVNVSGYTSDVTFGVQDGVTDLFDVDAGDEVPSPDPPTGVSAYFHYPDNPPYQDFLDTTKLSTSLIPVEYPAVWTLKAKSISVSGTATWHWNTSDIANIPSDLYVTLVTPSGSIDMRSTDQCQGMSIDADTTYTFTIIVTSEVEYTMELRAGWNMVSLPVVPDDMSAASVLDGIAFFQLVTWSGTGYLAASDFEAGRGYWLLVLEDVNVTVTGIPVDEVTLTLSPGWSMIGGPYTSVQAADVFPGFYQLVTWTGTGYTPATVFEPGKGYWALVLTETQIQLPPA